MHFRKIRPYIGLCLVTLLLICAPIKSDGLSISDIPNPHAEIITGQGIESRLADAKAQGVANSELLPPLSRDRPDVAALAGLDAVIKALKQKLPSFLSSPNVPMALVGSLIISGVSLLFSSFFFFKANQRIRHCPSHNFWHHSERLSTGEVQSSQLADWVRAKENDELNTNRFKSGSFFLGVYGILSIVFTLVAYAYPRWLAVVFGLSFPIVFACKNLPRLWRSPRNFCGQFVFSFLFALIFYGVAFGLLGTGLVIEAEGPIAPINAIFLAIVASAFTTINWRRMEDSSSGRSSRYHPAGTYGSSAGGSSGSSGGSSGDGFGGGSSDGGGAGGDW